MITIDVRPLGEPSVDPLDAVADVCPLCGQPIDLLDDVADVDDGEGSALAHINCPHAV